MQVGTLTISNIRLAEMIGAKSNKPIGPYLLVRSELGGQRYWEVFPGAFKR